MNKRVNDARSMFRRLLPALLLPALLFGAGAGAPAARTPDGGADVLVAVDAISASPALPGSAAVSVMAALAAPVPVRASDRHGPDGPSGTAAGDPTGCTRAAQLERSWLLYVRALERARLSLPATCSNPPPVPVA